MPRSTLAILFLLLSAALGTEATAQLDARALMQEGNALFRSGLYRAALLRYREASAAGLDSALLAYNFGVTYTKLGELEAAERSFLRAAEEPNLTPLATYNLGLVRLASDRDAQARESFATVERSAGDRELRRLAAAAVASLEPATVEAPESDRPARLRRTAIEADGKRVPGLSLSIDAAFGNDDNANRTPAEPYVDFAQPGQPLVTPEPLAASYVPVNAVAEYAVANEAGDTDFYFRYRLDGEYYTEDLANDESNQRLDLGADIVLGERENRRRELRSSFFMTRHYQRNFDPDTGLDRDILGLDISERFYYGGAGVEGDFDHYIGRWRWGLDMRLERREYDRVPLVANYDNELYLLGFSADYSIDPATTLTLGIRSYRRLFDEQRARDLDGVMFDSNPAIEYGYQGVELGARRRITSYLAIDLSYLLLDRTDRFLGYNDYSQDVLRLRATVTPGSRLRMSFGVVSRLYDYPNAFAFNAPAAGPKELEDVAGELHAEFRVGRNIVLFAQLATSDVTSTDTRVEYTRAQTMLGATWRR